MDISYSLVSTRVQQAAETSLSGFNRQIAPARLTVLVADYSPGAQVQQVQSELKEGRSRASILTTTADHRYCLYSLTQSAQLQQGAPTSHLKQKAVLLSKRLSLSEGPARQLSDEWSNLSITARVPDSTNSTPPAWQLQQQAVLPPCRGLQQLPGSVSACCLLTHSALLNQQQQPDQQQQHALGQLLGGLPAGSSSSNQQLLERLTASAAAAISSMRQPSAVVTVNDLICRDDAMYAAAEAAALGSDPSRSQCQEDNMNSSSSSSESAYFIAGTDKGQVWVCAANSAIVGPSSNNSKHLPAVAGAGQMQQQQQHCSTPCLLVELQQPILALLPIPSVPANSSSCSRNASAVLVVGNLGRVGLLHLTQQQAQHANATSNRSGAATAAKALQWCMTSQQLPFQLQAAELIWNNAQQKQQKQEQQQQSGLAVLLLSSLGLLYLADLTAAVAAVTQSSNTESSSNSQKTLSLQPVRLKLPGRVSKLWVCSHAEQEGNTVILQLQNSNHLIRIQHNVFECLEKQRQQRYHQENQTSDAEAATSSSSTTTSESVTAAAAVRQQVNGAMSALEILGAARRRLEQVIIRQDEYLTAVGQNMALLRAFNHNPLQKTAASTTAAAVLNTAAAAAAAATVHCQVQLQGMWPAPAAAATPGSSSSLHLAVSVHLECQSSSSSSALGLGAGWQVLVSFLGESSHTPSCQSTVPITASSRALSVSLLLPLPQASVQLLEGGWIQVYAVREPPSSLLYAAAAAAAGVASNSEDGSAVGLPSEQQQQRVSSEAVDALPAVALLSQQYVSVLQLSSMLAANAAAAAEAMLHPQTTIYPTAARQSPAELSFTCVMQLQATTAVIARNPTASNLDLVEHHHHHQQQQQQPADTSKSHKRPRSEHQPAAKTGASEEMQQQQQLTQNHQQQQHQQQQLGAGLGRWLKAVAYVPEQQQQQHVASGSFLRQYHHSSSLLTPGTGMAVALLQGQVSYRLCFNARGIMTWASRPVLPQNPQRQQQQRSFVATTTAAENQQQMLSLPVQVAMQSSYVSGLAQMHRAFILSVLQQLPRAPAAAGAEWCAAQYVTVGSSSSGICHIVTNKQRLQTALQQLKVLHQQLMQLQDAAENAGCKREQLTMLLRQQVQIYGPKIVSNEMSDLMKVVNSWESGIKSAYGRFLLAVSAAAAIEFMEG